MKRRTFLSMSSIVGLTSLAGCNTGWLNQPERQDTGENRSTPESTPNSTDGSAEIIAEFNGRKSTVTDSFATTYPQLRFDIDFSVTSGFTAHLIDPTGEADDRLLLDVPHTGFRGTIIVHDQQGSNERALQIQTDDMEGSDIDHLGWEITVWTPELILRDDE